VITLFAMMKNRIFIALALVMILCGMVPNLRAQQFTVSTDTINVYFNSDKDTHFQNKFWRLERAVKYHGYYFLKFGDYCYYDFDWDNAIVVAVPEMDGPVKNMALPEDFNRTFTITYDMFVRDNLLYVKSLDKYNSDLWPDIQPGYFLNETNWTWQRVQNVSDIAYEDDRYQVKVGCGLLFVEKQLTWEANTSNGSLQMEPVYKQYKRYGEPIRILKNDGKYYFIHRCQIRELGEAQHPGGRVYRTAIFRDPAVRELFDGCRFCGENDGYFAEDYIDEAQIVNDVTSYRASSSHNYYYIDGIRHGDTIFEGAFCVDDHVYVVVNTPQTTYIARLDGDSLTMVTDLGQHFECIDPLQKSRPINRLSMSPNCCLLEFNSKDGRSSGVIDIEDTTVRIRYFKHIQSSRS